MHGARDILNSVVVAERLWVLDRVSVVHGVGGAVDVGQSVVCPKGDEERLGVVFDVGGEVLQGASELGRLGDVVRGVSAPDLRLGEGLYLKVCDDAQVSGAALEGVEEVGVCGVCGLDKCAVCEDDL
jgi:hypothetical protein